MNITSADKGLITKGRKTGRFAQSLVNKIQAGFINSGLPKQQAKHATRKFLVTVQW